jgi:hypothetical protein
MDKLSEKQDQLSMTKKKQTGKAKEEFDKIQKI